jgi:hypothetical protein
LFDGGWRLLAGDIITLALVTWVGFGFHSEGQAWLRMGTTFGPLVVSWLLVAPHLGAFDLRRAAEGRQLWRPFWAMVLGAPFAAWLRGVLLGTPIQTIFVVVLGGVSALALLAWRGIYWGLAARR